MMQTSVLFYSSLRLHPNRKDSFYLENAPVETSIDFLVFATYLNKNNKNSQKDL